MSGAEEALVIPCGGGRLVAIHHRGGDVLRLGLVVIVGGPQYRVGSHRQFVLLARACARAGIHVLRFDYRGMGDSDGPPATFEDVDADIRAAVDTLLARVPSLEGVVLWGLCDAASAALMYAPGDPRVRGLVLLNPWVHTEAVEARARLKHYYLARLASPAFWRKLAGGGIDWRDSLGSLLGFLRRARGGGAPGPSGAGRPHFLERMRAALTATRAPIGLVLSGRDLVAAEFTDLAGGAWRDVCAGALAGRCDLPDANHTFASQAWRDAVAARTIAWVGEWGARAPR